MKTFLCGVIVLLTCQQSYCQSPLPLLNYAQEIIYKAGLATFKKVWTEEAGLGPNYSASSCMTCHGIPSAGGSSRIRVTRFGKITSGVFDPMNNEGGPVLQNRETSLAVLHKTKEVIPPDATIVSKRQATPLYGLGLIEAIPDQTIINLSIDPTRASVQGRVSIVRDINSGKTRIGRFGWKNQHATLVSVCAESYSAELGITNRLFPNENAPNGNLEAICNTDRVIKDPEDGRVARSVMSVLKPNFELAADFIRFLAPPVRKQPSPNSWIGTGNVDIGKWMFNNIGCAKCHVPFMQTGTNVIPALSNKTVNLYSDLLLHDMGSLGDGMVEGAALGREMRTAPLWGLSDSAPYLHDGRAATIEEAILAHEGQGATSRDVYSRKSEKDKALILQFLSTL